VSLKVKERNGRTRQAARLNKFASKPSFPAKLMLVALVGTLPLRAGVEAQERVPSASYNYHLSKQDSVHTARVHNYESEAIRANDALLITEVKAALAHDGVTDYRAVVVDCDHCTVLLNGVVGSSADARRAAMVARNVDGVVGVKNELKWH